MSQNAHARSDGKDVGVIHRERDYRQRGHTHVLGTPGHRKVYDDTGRIQRELRARGTRPRERGVTAASEQHALAYTFAGKPDNFKLGFVPYHNQAHHLLPCEAFAKLTAKQRKLMKKVEYNVNDGPNIIFLPSLARDSAFHGLPYHSGSHPQYTKLVKQDMVKVRDALDREIEKDPKHENWSPPADLPRKLRALEDDSWRHLTNCGAIRVNALAPAKPALSTDGDL